MYVGMEVPIPETGLDPAGELNAVLWLKDRQEGLRRDYLELFLPDAAVE